MVYNEDVLNFIDGFVENKFFYRYWIKLKKKLAFYKKLKLKNISLIK